MTIAPKIDIHDLGSVRRAAAGTEAVVLGDDWVAPEAAADMALRETRRARGLRGLISSPLARKIITFNLLALIVMVAGVLYLSPSRDNLGNQRGQALLNNAVLIASVFEAQLPPGGGTTLGPGGLDPAATLGALDLSSGSRIAVHGADGALIVSVAATAAVDTGEPAFLTGLLFGVWDTFVSLFAPGQQLVPMRDAGDPGLAEALTALGGAPTLRGLTDLEGRSFYVAAAPILQGGTPIGAVVLTSASGEIDALVRSEREQLLQMFLVGVVVSVVLSLMLASTIANPIADLAAAAEIGRDRNARKMSPRKVRIPDLTGRPDEIGRLSGALRGMVAALHGRIELNEQFAADVAHEIKNPLASLRSAVGTLRRVERADQREKLLDIIDHDVRRLDRLVSDISNASRLDAELVKEEEESFDLLQMLGRLAAHLGREAEAKGIDFITDLPPGPIMIQGLEGRLAQVFVNIVTNAISFCEDGDAIRLWVRQRDNRVLVVVEDTGPGIPESALTKIFKRFYSERPPDHFGNNSGLGLAISKQIVEAHGGAIWAENIRPTEADPVSEPLGARFVVGLPV